MISNFETFQEILKQEILKVTALYLTWNPEICQDAPNRWQDDLALLIAKSSSEGRPDEIAVNKNLQWE
jgi:hypothetical protein